MKELKRVPPNIGVQKEYQKKLDKLVKSMSKSVMYWVLADFGNRTAREMAIAIQKRIKQWRKIFGDRSEQIALWFVKSIKKHTEVGMRNSFRESGFNLKKGVANDDLKLVEYENISLIKSIPEKYFTGIETVALLSMAYGWEKDDLTGELFKRYNIASRRVKLIARDQTQKATELFKRSICLNAGIKKARWVYTYRSERPRESHVELNGALYDLYRGCYDYYENEYIHPGQKINCQCDFVPIIEDDLDR